MLILSLILALLILSYIACAVTVVKVYFNVLIWGVPTIINLLRVWRKGTYYKGPVQKESPPLQV